MFSNLPESGVHVARVGSHELQPENRHSRCGAGGVQRGCMRESDHRTGADEYRAGDVVFHGEAHCTGRTGRTAPAHSTGCPGRLPDLDGPDDAESER